MIVHCENCHNNMESLGLVGRDVNQSLWGCEQCLTRIWVTVNDAPLSSEEKTRDILSEARARDILIKFRASVQEYLEENPE